MKIMTLLFPGGKNRIKVRHARYGCPARTFPGEYHVTAVKGIPGRNKLRGKSQTGKEISRVFTQGSDPFTVFSPGIDGYHLLQYVKIARLAFFEKA
jgi:hypothetical protein